MNNTPILSSSSLLQYPTRKRPVDHKLEGLGASDGPVHVDLPSCGTPQSLSHNPEVPSALRKRTQEAKGRMQRMYTPYQDVVEGKEVFKKGISLMPKELFDKLYIAKVASKDCILSRISTTLREVDALEKEKDALLAYEKYEKQQLAAACLELQLFKEEAQARASDIMDDVAFRHAVYADELVALTVTDMQLNHMLAVSDPEDSNPSDDVDEDHEDESHDEDDEDDDF
ncbi:hypothetical protein BU15DRAFT_72686 [Melanogaster broomeanus]|nr:hypothetical protein BU15DRAFT_72686 [Melanogaster broomeanus]